jgi:hypothetical protein
MNVIFNEISTQNLNIVNKENILQNLVDTCKAIQQVNDIIGKSIFKLRISRSFWELDIWTEQEKNYANPIYPFLLSISEAPYLPETPECEVNENIYLDGNLSFENEHLDLETGLRVASSWENSILVVSLANNFWETKREIIIERENAENIVLKNATLPEHIFELLEFFPIWENYDFNKWKINKFHKPLKEGKKGEEYKRRIEKEKQDNPKKDIDVKVLPMPKLSDLVWLKFIGENEIWDNSDKTRTRAVLWQKFVDKLDTFPVGGLKEACINPIFDKIVKINQFQNANKICSKRKRPIFTWNGDYYLLPDTQHGAFEVYNDKQVHQGEWHFYGDENMEKKAEKSRNICN